VACIDKGIAPVQATLAEVQRDVIVLRLVDSTLDPTIGSVSARKRYFDTLASAFERQPSPIRKHMAAVMRSFAPGLFVGDDDTTLPDDNLELERWFRLPKGHERRIHGHAHAGVRIVQEGPTLLPTLDAHRRHPEPFSAEELIPTLHAAAPPCQREAESRRRVMVRARSRKQRPILLADLERRYHSILVN
jgi:hypothetical protein